MQKACTNCHLITDADRCPLCKGNDFSKDWLGFVVVVDAKRSIIAQKMNIEAPGQYALRVRG